MSRKARQWQQSEIDILGKLSDDAVSKELGIAKAVVRKKRVSLGISPAFSPADSIEWSGILAELGKASDSAIAKKHGISQWSVNAKRRELGIVAFDAASNASSWNESNLALLGTKTDKDIAEQLGISAVAVARKRRRLNMPPFDGFIERGVETRRAIHGGVNWPESALARLGKVTDREIAKELDCALSTVRLKRLSLGIKALYYQAPKPNAWGEKSLASLGKVPDKQIAEALDLTTNAVVNVRTERQIAPYGTAKRIATTAWSDEDTKLLGTEPDSDIAGRLGISRFTVAAKRRALGIRAYRPQTGFPPFDTLAGLAQRDFFERLAFLYKRTTSEILTYPALSEMCLWSVSRLQKWFTPGSAQEPLQQPIRQHIYLAVAHACKARVY